MPLPQILQEEQGLNEGQAIAARIRRWDAGETRGPYTMELYPTMTCNIDCVFCDTTYRKGEQSGNTDEHSQVMRWLRAAPERSSTSCELPSVPSSAPRPPPRRRRRDVR